MQKIRKILRVVSEIFKDGRTNGPTDGRTDMGDYIGPSRVNPGSKMYQEVIMKQAICFYYNLWCKCIIFQKIVPLGTIDFRPPIESDMDKSFSKLKFQM